MPIYEYECRGCGRRFEVIHRSGDRGKPACPGCASKKVARIISAAGFVLKGSGWYKTDYPSEARKKAVEAEKGTKPDAGGEKKEKKPAEKKAAPADPSP